MNDEVMNWFRNQISAGNIAVILFMAGGFYYTTEYKVSELESDIRQTNRSFDEHMEYRFRPLQKTVRNNSEAIQQAEGNFQSLEKLLEQQQENSNNQFERLEKRLDYIINRIDGQ